MGGNGYFEEKYFSDVYSVSLEALVTYPASAAVKIWKELPLLICVQSCPLNVGGSLLTLGGWDLDEDNDDPPLSTIQRYNHDINT